jgi:hypothetical protein
MRYVQKYIILKNGNTGLLGSSAQASRRVSPVALMASDEVKSLAAAYIEAVIIPSCYGTDGFHIAAATVKGLDFEVIEYAENV